MAALILILMLAKLEMMMEAVGISISKKCVNYFIHYWLAIIEVCGKIGLLPWIKSTMKPFVSLIS